MRTITAKAIALLIAFSTATLAQEKGSFTDPRDKKKYKTVKIGEQVWMAENLNYADKDSKCYGDKPANCTQYGRLYNWETAMKACPAGWHLPRNAELEKLFSFVDSTKNETSKRLKAKSGWTKKEANGTDNFGFSALPGGNGNSRGYFSLVGEQGAWWGATEKPNKRNPDETLGTQIFIDERYDKAMLYDVLKNNLFSVRCIQGDGEEAAKIDAEAEENAANAEAQPKKRPRPNK